MANNIWNKKGNKLIHEKLTEDDNEKMVSNSLMNLNNCKQDVKSLKAIEGNMKDSQFLKKPINNNLFSTSSFNSSLTDNSLINSQMIQVNQN